MSSLRSIFGKILASLSNTLSTIKDNHLRKSRMKVGQKELAIKHGKSSPITSDQREGILSFWKPYRDVSKDMQWFEFYNWCFDGKADLRRFIPDNLYYAEIDFFFTNPRRSYELDDKNLYDLFFQDVKLPRAIVRKCNGQLMDKDYHVLTLEQAIDLCQQESCIVCKRSRNSGGGKGVRFYDMKSTTTDDLKEMLGDFYDIIVQEKIDQHETLSMIHNKSINTIRIMSFVFDGQVHLLSSVLRMGRNGARVDNASSGGIVCGIDESGRLKEFAYDTKGNRCTQHPQGAIFKGHEIAGYEKCCELVKSLAGRFCTTSTLLSWDLAIGADGEPIIIEVNMTFGQVDFHQMCNGPIFGDLTERVLDRIYGTNK